MYVVHHRRSERHHHDQVRSVNICRVEARSTCTCSKDVFTSIAREHAELTSALFRVCSFDDLDLTESPRNRCPQPTANETDATKPCCASTWIKIVDTEKSHEESIYCGRAADSKLILRPFISTSNHVTVKFHTQSGSAAAKDRGFHLTYIIGPRQSKQCKINDFQCANGKCIPAGWVCNRRDECGAYLPNYHLDSGY